MCSAIMWLSSVAVKTCHDFSRAHMNSTNFLPNDRLASARCVHDLPQLAVVALEDSCKVGVTGSVPENAINDY